MERFTVLLKPVQLKLKCDLNFQGHDGKSSHASFCKVLCSNIKSDLKPRTGKELCSLCRLVFFFFTIDCALLNTEYMSSKLFILCSSRVCGLNLLIAFQLLS